MRGDGARQRRRVKRKPRTDRQMESEKRRTTQCTSTLEQTTNVISVEIADTLRFESAENIDESATTLINAHSCNVDRARRIAESQYRFKAHVL